MLEMAIVLVIIGLIVGGVLTGQALIRAGELQTVVTELNQHKTAFLMFRERYKAIPGDMADATNYWGTAGGNGRNQVCADTNSGTNATCNGNGDGALWFDSTTTFVYEDLRSWQHLSNAGLLTGTYSGTWAPGNGLLGGFNVPKSKVTGGVYYPWGEASGYWAATTDTFGGTVGNVINFWREVSGYILTPLDAYNIDTKMDNGKPANGLIVGYKGDATNPCTSNANTLADDQNATYSTTNNNKICYVYFTKAF